MTGTDQINRLIEQHSHILQKMNQISLQSQDLQ